MNFNRVIIAGHLTRSPELRYAPTGQPVCRFGVATNMAWVDETGEKHEEVEFHNVVAFGKQAESTAAYLRKGQLVLVEGRLRTSSWMVEEQKRSRTEIVAQRLQFGPKRAGEPPVDDEPLVSEEDAAAAAEPDDEIPF